MFTYIRTTLIAFILITPAAALAQEDEKQKEERNDPTYSSIRLSSVSTDFDNLDSAVNLGFTLGISIPGIGFLPSDMLAAEIDLSSTIIPGENKGGAGIGGGGGGGSSCDPISQALGQCTPGGGGGGGGSSAKNTSDTDDLRLNGVGIFLTGRSPGDFFGTARVGYRFVESTIRELDEEQSGSAWGLGLGYRYSKMGKVELSYNQYGSELQLLSLVVSY